MSCPVVLVHGLATSSARTWGETGWLDLLADAGRQTVALDLPGHGSSMSRTEADDFTNLEANLFEKFPDEPVDAIGFSLGARILLTIAARHSDRFERLVVAGVGRNLFERDTDRGARIAAAIAGEVDPEDPEARHFGALAESPDVDREALATLLNTPRPTLDSGVLGQVSCPVLVVIGDADFAGPADDLIAALPDSELCVLRGVDHFATPKSFDFIDAALGFLGASPF